MNRRLRRMRLSNGEYTALQFLHFLGSIEADADDVVRAVLNADRYGTLEELKRCIMHGVREIGYVDEDEGLSALKIRIPSIGECVKKAAGWVAGRIGGERARLSVEQKVSDINREVTKVTEHPVGQAIIAGGLIAATGGLGAGSLVGKIAAAGAKGLSTVAAGAKAVGGAALKLGGAAVKGLGGLGKMAWTGAKKLGGAVIAAFKRKPGTEGPAAGYGGAPQPFYASGSIVPEATAPPMEPYASRQPRIIDVRGVVENRKNRELLPIYATAALISLLL